LVFNDFYDFCDKGTPRTSFIWKVSLGPVERIKAAYNRKYMNSLSKIRKLFSCRPEWSVNGGKRRKTGYRYGHYLSYAGNDHPSTRRIFPGFKLFLPVIKKISLNYYETLFNNL
jgi:hypothetical protein